MTTPHTPDAPRSDPLKPILREAETQLEARLAEVCRADPVGGETTGELMRLEDALRNAARAAKDMVSIRRRLRVSDSAAPPPLDPSDPQQPGQVDQRASAWEEDSPGGETGGGALREVTDAAGRRWRVWAVTPGQFRPLGDDRLPDAYHNGWLAFETVDGELRKRLTGYPPDWNTAHEAVITDLLARAADAHRRGR